MVQPTTGFVELGEGRLYYEAAGDGMPLVWAHAGFVDSRMWDDQWPDFARSYRVIRYDMRGFGKSTPAEGPVSRRQDLYELLQRLGVERAALLGCSLGGGMMLDFALEHPKMVSALVVVSAVPGGFEFQGAPPSLLMEMMAAIQEGDLARASELQMRIWVDGPFRQPEQVDPLVRARAAEMSQTALAYGTWAKADAQPLRPLEPPAAQRLGQVLAPTLVVAGALDDPEILRAAEVMAGAIPSARKVIIPGSAHLPNMEQPAAFNQTVLSFLAGLA